MTDPVRPVAPRAELIERIARTAAARIEWLETQGGFTSDHLAWAIESAIEEFAAAPVPCAASPADSREELRKHSPLEYVVGFCRQVATDGILPSRDWFAQAVELLEPLLATVRSVDRFEVIDETGRLLTRKPVHVELSYQDNGRTLKVFLTQQRATGEGARDAMAEEHALPNRDSRTSSESGARDGAVPLVSALDQPHVADTLPVAVALDPHRLLADLAQRLRTFSGSELYWMDVCPSRLNVAQWAEELDRIAARLRGEATVRVEESQ